MNQLTNSNQFQIGATYSRRYADSLGLDWRRAYREVIDELRIRHIRLPVYWDEIEPEPGSFNWKDLDWHLEEGEKADIKVLLNLLSRQAAESRAGGIFK